MPAKPVTPDDPIYRVRHSLAHVLAQAVLRLHPDAKLGFGPPIADGFYYDFMFAEPLSEEEFGDIEKEMRRIIKEDQPFTLEAIPAETAIERLESSGEPLKAEYARELSTRPDGSTLTFYTNGPFTDLCKGPHVESTGKLPQDGFKIHSIAGAYWRGDEKNPMLTRIYAWAFETKDELKAHQRAVEEAKQRDHRLLGAKLDIFHIADEVGKGLPLWLPNGAAIRHELEKLAYEFEFQRGYTKVATPQITKKELFLRSGHLPLYQEGMFPPMELRERGEGAGGDEIIESYYLRPMNCPHHHMVYAARPRSYRDLPMRLAEYGSVYRFERAGALQGLTRVRGMCMNDAHIYTTAEQLKEEFKEVVRLHHDYYKLFGLDDYFIRLSQWDPDDPKRAGKYVDDPESWAFAEKLTKEALEEMGVDFVEVRGEAAFYGPKADFQFHTVTGREFTLSTAQIDFAQPQRFELTYKDADGTDKTPFCIHRAPLGTHERFIAFMIERFGGAFPVWMAPIQARIIPVSEKFLPYARRVGGLLRERFVRAEVDESNHTMGKKIREAQTSKIPVAAVVGEQEEADNTVTVRRYGSRDQAVMPLDRFVSELLDEIATRRLPPARDDA